MVEQSYPRERHGYAILIAHLNDVVIADRASRLRDKLNAAAVSALYIIPEREKRVRTESNAFHGIKPLSLLLACEHLGLHLEYPLPFTLRKYVHVILAYIQVDCVVTVGAADIVNKLQVHNRR